MTNRDSETTLARQVRTPEEVVTFMGDDLERQGRHPTAGLPVSLRPLLNAAPVGEERAQVLAIIDSCEKSWGWIERSGEKGYSYTLTPSGFDQYTQIQEARRKAKIARRPLTGIGMAADRWFGEQRDLFPNLSPLVEKAIVALIFFVAGLVSGLLL